MKKTGHSIHCLKLKSFITDSLIDSRSTMGRPISSHTFGTLQHTFRKYFFKVMITIWLLIKLQVKVHCFIPFIYSSRCPL